MLGWLVDCMEGVGGTGVYILPSILQIPGEKFLLLLISGAEFKRNLHLVGNVYFIIYNRPQGANCVTS